MTSMLFEPSALERKLTEILKVKVKAEIERRADPAGVARALGIAPQGVEALLGRSEWSLETAIRVAEALHIIDQGMAERLAG